MPAIIQTRTMHFLNSIFKIPTVMFWWTLVFFTPKDTRHTHLSSSALIFFYTIQTCIEIINIANNHVSVLYKLLYTYVFADTREIAILVPEKAYILYEYIAGLRLQIIHIIYERTMHLKECIMFMKECIIHTFKRMAGVKLTIQENHKHSFLRDDES